MESSISEIRGRPLIPGEGRGPLLRLTHPISFWGGVEPTRGRIVDPRHPEFDFSIAGTVLALPAAVGSSSSSAIMLELLREGTAPAAILMGKADAILALGAVVGREIGYDPIPILEIAPDRLEQDDDFWSHQVGVEGEIRISDECRCEVLARFLLLVATHQTQGRYLMNSYRVLLL